jgi:chromatin segregation and condensation protein Rec8/ScpA/Scc1 (kleisin family)
MDEKEIMGLITSEYSWEQIIYKIIAWEGMDPWNLDLSLLSRSFMTYMSKMEEELDFKIPAKYVVIAAVLLRMKSDHIEYLKMLAQGQEELAVEDAGMAGEEEAGSAVPGTLNGEINLGLASLNVPTKRQPVRKIVTAELIAALRNALRTDERRGERHARRREQIQIAEENITERIALLYKRIDSLLERLKDEEIEYSKLVNIRSRDEVLNTFVPLIHLDYDKKVRCRQEDLFKEIFIRKAQPGDVPQTEEPTETKEKQQKSKKPAAKAEIKKLSLKKKPESRAKSAKPKKQMATKLK